MIIEINGGREMECVMDREQEEEKIEQLLTELQQERRLRRLAELKSLQAQVEPHFLYNTLDAIMWLVEAEKQQEAVEMLSQLSLFFRISLSKGQDVICLKEEIEHTRSYMEIQKRCYHDIMDYKIKLPKELEEMKLPKFTIQPLAENALYHGAKAKRGKSMIQIACQDLEEDILIIVEDDGAGMKSDKLIELQQALEEGKRVGFGLAVVHERIRLYCGKPYGVKINSKYGEGTRVEVQIPKELLPI